MFLWCPPLQDDWFLVKCSPTAHWINKKSTPPKKKENSHLILERFSSIWRRFTIFLLGDNFDGIFFMCFLVNAQAHLGKCTPTRPWVSACLSAPGKALSYCPRVSASLYFSWMPPCIPWCGEKQRVDKTISCQRTYRELFLAIQIQKCNFICRE